MGPIPRTGNPTRPQGFEISILIMNSNRPKDPLVYQNNCFVSSLFAVLCLRIIPFICWPQRFDRNYRRRKWYYFCIFYNLIDLPGNKSCIKVMTQPGLKLMNLKWIFYATSIQFTPYHLLLHSHNVYIRQTQLFNDVISTSLQQLSLSLFVSNQNMTSSEASSMHKKFFIYILLIFKN